MHSVFSFMKYFHGERSLSWLIRMSFVLLLKVTVSGPFSPYEVKCYSMTKVSKFRYGNDGNAFIVKHRHVLNCSF